MSDWIFYAEKYREILPLVPAAPTLKNGKEFPFDYNLAVSTKIEGW